MLLCDPQIIRERIYPHTSIREGIIWNSHPGALLTRPGYSDSYQDFPFDFAPRSPVYMEKEKYFLTDSSLLYGRTNNIHFKRQGRGRRGCPPFSSGCEDKIDKQYGEFPPHSANEDDDDDYNKGINSQKRGHVQDIIEPLSPSKEHRKLLGILLPFGHPSRPDNEMPLSHQSYPSLLPSFVRGGTNWNSSLHVDRDSNSKFTAVIFTQVSAASSVVHYNAPIFKLVSNVAASEHVDKVRIKDGSVFIRTSCPLMQSN